MPVYNVGRTYLLELYHSELQADEVRIVDSPTSWTGRHRQAACARVVGGEL